MVNRFYLYSLSGLRLKSGRNPNAQVDARVADLLSKMTLDEKISQCSSDIPAIERLGIPAYMWYTEACMECWHGSVLRFLKI